MIKTVFSKWVALPLDLFNVSDMDKQLKTGGVVSLQGPSSTTSVMYDQEEEAFVVRERKHGRGHRAKIVYRCSQLGPAFGVMERVALKQEEKGTKDE